MSSNKITEAEKKRKRSNQSSTSDLDNSSLLEPESQKTQSKPSKKKDKKKSRIIDQITTEEKLINTEEGDMDKLHMELKGINERLGKVLTKNDPHLENVIKETFVKMKEDFLKSVFHRIEILESRLFEREKENDRLTEKIRNLEKNVKTKENENESLKREISKIETGMNEKLNEHEQYSRRNNIRIEGIEEKGTETSHDTSHKVVDVINTYMKDVKIKMDDIDIAHRLGKKREGKRQIIVKFKSRLHTESILRKRKLLKGSGIFINEDLTKTNQHVLACVRKKLPDEIEAAWTRDGRIIYKNKTGTIHTLRYEDFQTWIDLPWPATR